MTDLPELKMNRVELLNIRISCCTEEMLNSHIKKVIMDGRKEMILNVNVNCMNIAYRNRAMRKILNDADVVFCDGDGVRMAAKALGIEIPEKITYNRWIWDLAHLSAENGFTWYLLGSEKKVIENAASILNNRFTKLRVVGFHSGFFDSENDLKTTLNDINRLSPNVLILGMGMPRQELWLSKHCDELNFNVALTGGAVFDYISGKAKITPELFYKLKLEWLYRLINEPKRLFIRYVIGNPLFLMRIINHHIIKNIRP